MKPSPAISPVFTTTHWSVVLAAGRPDSSKGDEALEKLCRTYWYPLYFFVRRSGYAQHDAEDLTQGSSRALGEGLLERGGSKQRQVSLVSLGRIPALCLELSTRRSPQKRGGGCTFISLNDESAEREYLRSAPADVSAEKLFARQWATTLLDQVVARLREEFIADGKAALFEELKIFLTGEKRAASYADLAAKLATTEAALKMSVSRMRQRYGGLLRAEIADTVAGPEEIDGELHALFAALS